jgi:hypothetical protein
VLLHGVTAISWKSSKQILVARSTNHSKIIVIYEASQECAWLRRIIDHIQISCGICVIGPPTIIYEDNAACVAQIQIRYVKTNYTKHISPNCLSTSIAKSGEISILQTKSCDNYADLFTNSLPLATFDKCFKGISMRRLKNSQGSWGEILLTCFHC